MPIILDDNGGSTNVAALKDTFSPTYFDEKLTGRMTKNGTPTSTGVLGINADPSQAPAGVRQMVPGDLDMYHRIVTNANVTSHQLPIDIVPYTVWRQLDSIALPDLSNAIVVGHAQDKSHSYTAYVTLDVHTITLDIEKKAGRSLRCVWRAMLWIVNDRETDAGRDIPICDHWRFISPQPNSEQVYLFFETDVTAFMEKIIHDLQHVVTRRNLPNWVVDDGQVMNDYKDVHTYEAVSRAAHMWQADIDNVIADTVARLYNSGKVHSTDQAFQYVLQLMHHIEGYPVSLAFYRPIYDALVRILPSDQLTKAVKSNLNLLLTNTMQKLDDLKPTLERCPYDPDAHADSFFNREQARAIESHEPLVMIQSVAGSGKSSTIRGRIKFMIDSGVSPEDITVLSFTNAAADHIRDICPGVHSITISSMVHTIYIENFDHELSSIPTLINSLKIWFPRNSFAENFAMYLRALKNSETDAFTRMNTFIENNYDAVLNILNTCGQTTLELEIIMCYQHIGDYIEPPEITSKHLIVDEVQDNSIFDFIYTLEYCAKHAESLYIVGRCIADVKPYELRETRA